MARSSNDRSIAGYHHSLGTRESETQAINCDDPLTQVANRKTFDLRLQEEWKRARRNGSAISLLLLRIDQFQQFNDQHGQQFSNSMLQRLAFTLSRVPRRSTDLFGRYGNEEFAIVLPDTPTYGAKRLAEILLQRARFCDVTISIGTGTVIPSESDFRQLLDSAIQALQQAKQEGGNCVVVG
ncbi:MAG: GGDEF domain-containing protein [Cyanobacteria bacterium RU_5_0]|nr:GGDEF domain-containing protein [Cyanobacteria bacterium RU_5_0]